MSTNKAAIGRNSEKSFGAQNLIVAVPLVLSLLFVFTLLALQSHKAVSTMAVTKTTANQSISGRTALPVVTQPDLPTLSNTPNTALPVEDGMPAQPDIGKVGPSSSEAAGYLQNAPKTYDDRGDGALQATRKTLKLDELSL